MVSQVWGFGRYKLMFILMKHVLMHVCEKEEWRGNGSKRSSDRIAAKIVVHLY